PDLVREILLKAEDAPANARVGRISIDGRGQGEVLEHIELLTEAGLLESQIQRTSSAHARVITASVHLLTYAGHQFIEQARNEGMWHRAKSTILSKGGGMTLELIQGVLSALAKQHLGLP